MSQLVSEINLIDQSNEDFAFLNTKNVIKLQEAQDYPQLLQENKELFA